MNKKEIFIPFLVIGLSALFAFILLMVFVSNGKSKKWIARKMKIGALLLTLSTASCGPPFVTCYDMPAPSNSMWMNGITQNGLEIMLDTSNVLTGTIEDRQSDNFSFAIQSADAQIVQKNSLIPLDGKFDNYTENFKIEIDKTLLSGTYSLKLYDVELNQQSNLNPRQEFILLIKNK